LAKSGVPRTFHLQDTIVSKPEKFDCCATKGPDSSIEARRGFIIQTRRETPGTRDRVALKLFPIFGTVEFFSMFEARVYVN